MVFSIHLLPSILGGVTSALLSKKPWVRRGGHFARTLVQFNDLVAEIASQVYNNDSTIKNQHLIVLDLAMVPKQSSEENRWQTRSTRAKSAFVRCRRVQQRAAVCCARHGGLQF